MTVLKVNTVRERDVTLDLTAREGWSCCSSVPPSPASGKAEGVFPAGMRTQRAHVHYVYTYISGWPHRAQTLGALTQNWTDQHTDQPTIYMQW